MSNYKNCIYFNPVANDVYGECLLTIKMDFNSFEVFLNDNILKRKNSFKGKCIFLNIYNDTNEKNICTLFKGI